jgi:hypothetical protein
MPEQTERWVVTARCRWCRTDLARLVPEPPPVGWRMDRLVRVPHDLLLFTLGVSELGDTRYVLPTEDGTLPSPRMLPVPVDGDQAELVCRRCRFRLTPTLAELRVRATRAEGKGQRMLLAP